MASSFRDFIFGSSVEPEALDDTTWALNDVGSTGVARSMLRRAGLPTEGLFGRSIQQRHQINSPEEAAFVRSIYSEGGTDPDDRTLGPFIQAWITRSIDPNADISSLGTNPGFTPARSYGQGVSLLKDLLSPEGTREFTLDLKVAIDEGDDSKIYNMVHDAVQAVGTTAFSRSSQSRVNRRLEWLYQRFSDMKNIDKSLPRDMNFLEYLGHVGAAVLKDTFPGMDWDQIKALAAGSGDIEAGIRTEPRAESQPAATTPAAGSGAAGGDIGGSNPPLPPNPAGVGPTRDEPSARLASVGGTAPGYRHGEGVRPMNVPEDRRGTVSPYLSPEEYDAEARRRWAEYGVR